MNSMSLDNRVAIVTGAARGIGLAIASRLSAAGAPVAAVDVDLAGAEEAARNLQSAGAHACGFVCDVSDAQSVKMMVEKVLKTFNHIDVLVNNAGIGGKIAPVREQTDDDWRRVIDVNLTGVFYCCRAVIPCMLKQGGGRIVNVASIAGKEGNPNQSAYSAAKAGVIGFTKSLGKELAKQNILVNAVAPTIIETELTSNMTREQHEFFSSRIPMGRFGKPQEAAALVHWLVSNEASYSTGAVFDLSGGRATY
jgi:2-dehydro-3-deoxy-L-rhamnonate dehydrogenase (NAD+)